MSATSKRDRALQAGVEPVTDKSIHKGDEPMPDYLDVNMADPQMVAPIDEEPEKPSTKKRSKKKAVKESDDGEV